jgi:hypothetical protein
MFRKKGKLVLLVSTMHDRKEINAETGEKKKQEIICFYNQTKGVDMVDQMSSNYSVARKTNRWPVFFHLLNIAGINAQVVYFSNTQDKILRRHFLGQLSEALTTQHIKTHLMNSNFPRQLTTRINLYFGKVQDEKQEFPVPAPEDQNQKKRDVSYAPEKRIEKQKRVVLSAESLYAEIMEIITVMTALKCDFFNCIYPK